jgi:replicative DNA helicase
MSNVAPPQNLEAEQELLGTLLVFYKPALVHLAQSAGLTPNDFYRRSHEAVYRAVLRLHARAEHVDILTVTRFLQGQPHEQSGSWLENIGGAAEVELLACFHVTHGFRERAAIVHEDGRWRRWLRALYEAQESVHDRDPQRFWEAIGRVKDDVVPEPLRAIDGGKAAA